MSSPTLPYRLPESTKDQIVFLRELLKLPYNVFDAYENQPAISDEVAVEILSGVVLYHHLSRYQQHDVMQMLHRELRYRPVINLFIDKITDPMVSIYWGLWAKPTNELLADLELRETISSALGFAGMGGFNKNTKGRS